MKKYGYSMKSIKIELSCWRHDMETLSTLLVICEWIPAATNDSSWQRIINAEF